MPIVDGNVIALPQDARVDLGRQEVITFSAAAIGAGQSSVRRTTPSGFYEQLIGMKATYTCNGTPGDRNVGMTIFDNNSNVLYRVDSPTQQLANQARTYVWSTQQAFAYVSPLGFVVLPLPILMLHPTWQIQLGVTGVVVGDSAAGWNMTMIRYPNGPALEAELPGVEPLPLHGLGVEPLTGLG